MAKGIYLRRIRYVVENRKKRKKSLNCVRPFSHLICFDLAFAAVLGVRCDDKLAEREAHSPILEIFSAWITADDHTQIHEFISFVLL